MALVTFPGTINPLKFVATAKARLHTRRLVMRRCETLSPLGAPPFQYQPAILARHPGPKAMCLGSTSVVWLERGLGHLIRSTSCAKTVRLTAAVAYVKKGKRNRSRFSREKRISIPNQRITKPVFQMRHSLDSELSQPYR